MPKDAAPEIMPEMGIESLFNLRGKVALVTGGATGLGKMMAAAYVRNGVRVYIASRKLADLQKQAEVLSKLAPKDAPQPACIALEADVATKAGCDKLADQIKAKESKLHILVNNAGITWGAPMDDFPEDKGWDKIFALNVKSQFYLTVALLPLLEKDATNESHATVINISSVAGFNPIAESGLAAPGSGTFSYQPSKAASVHLTRTMAVSLAERNVLVNCICPGVFPSRMTAYGLEENKDVLEGIQPTGRIGSPQDIGGLAITLASRVGSHMTGNAIVVDGGQNLQFMAKI